MCRKLIYTTVALLLLSLPHTAGGQTGWEMRNRFGVGVHYWRGIDDGGLNMVRDNGMAWIATYQFKAAPLLKLEADVEMYPRDLVSAETRLFAPQAALILGMGIYAGLGVGTYYSEGVYSSGPFFAMRSGLDLQVLPTAFLDLSLNYRSLDWRDLRHVTRSIGFDTISFAAAFRYEI